MQASPGISHRTGDRVTPVTLASLPAAVAIVNDVEARPWPDALYASPGIVATLIGHLGRETMNRDNSNKDRIANALNEKVLNAYSQIDNTRLFCDLAGISELIDARRDFSGTVMAADISSARRVEQIWQQAH
jgi:hypothetical protein